MAWLGLDAAAGKPEAWLGAKELVEEVVTEGILTASGSLLAAPSVTDEGWPGEETCTVMLEWGLLLEIPFDFDEDRVAEETSATCDMWDEATGDMIGIMLDIVSGLRGAVNKRSIVMRWIVMGFI